MDSNILVPILITAAAGLLGTILTLVFQAYQAKRKERLQGSEPSRMERQAAYRELWAKIEQIHAGMRTNAITGDDFNKHIQELNTYIIQHSLYIEDEDWDLSNRYLDKVKRLREVIREAESPEIKDVEASTRPFPTEMVNAVQELRAANEEASQLREQLRGRFRKVLNIDA
jgi:hypothetical protein